MLDLTSLETGSSVKIAINDGDSEEFITVSVVNTEWNESRKPFAINFQIKETSDSEKWPTNSKILLGFDIIEDEFYRFLLKCPCKLQPNKTLNCGAKLKFFLN
jgi:hypothetical protein